MGLEPLNQLGRGVLAHARLRSREQRPFIDALAQADPVEHVAVHGRLGASPLAVHLVAVLLLRILTSTPGPFARVASHELSSRSIGPHPDDLLVNAGTVKPIIIEYWFY